MFLTLTRTQTAHMRKWRSFSFAIELPALRGNRGNTSGDSGRKPGISRKQKGRNLWLGFPRIKLRPATVDTMRRPAILRVQILMKILFLYSQ